MAESPIACLAATENFLALEFHSIEVPWWEHIVKSPHGPVVRQGFIDVPDRPGLGIEELDDQILAEHLSPSAPDLWRQTDEWNDESSHDRLWS